LAKNVLGEGAERYSELMAACAITSRLLLRQERLRVPTKRLPLPCHVNRMVVKINTLAQKATRVSARRNPDARYLIDGFQSGLLEVRKRRTGSPAPLALRRAERGL
jgi:hypothetical protein